MLSLQLTTISNPRAHIHKKHWRYRRNDITPKDIYEQKQRARERRQKTLNSNQSRKEYFEWMFSIFHFYGIYVNNGYYRVGIEDVKAGRLLGITPFMAKEYRLRRGHFPSEATHKKLLELDNLRNKVVIKEVYSRTRVIRTR